MCNISIIINYLLLFSSKKMNDSNLIIIQLYNNIGLFIIVKIIRPNKIIPLKSQNLTTVFNNTCIANQIYIVFRLYILKKSKFIVITTKHKYEY